MEAGRELDALVAERVFGWTQMSVFQLRPDGDTLNYGFPPEGYHPFGCVPPSYSTDIAAAWLVVEQFAADPACIVLVRTFDNEGPRSWECRIAVERVTFAYGDTAPLAICRAAMAALSVPPAVSPSDTEIRDV